MCCKAFHSQRFHTLLARAYVCTGTTSGTVKLGNSHCEGVVRHTGHRHGLDAFRSCCCFFCGHGNRTDNSVRADEGTSVTLDTVFRIPYRYVYGDTTFLVCGCAGRSCSVYVVCKCGYRQVVSFLGSYFCLDGIYEFNSVSAAALCMSCGQTFIFCIFPAFRNCNFFDLFCTLIDSCPVLCYDIITFTAIGSFCCCFHEFDGFFFRNDLRKLEECRLKNGVDTGRSHAGLDTDLNAVDHIEFNVVVCDECFYLSRQMLFQACFIPWAVQKEGSSVYQLFYHVIFVHIGRIMTCNKVCFVDQVGGFDRFLSETQVRHRYTAGLLGVIIEVSLSVHVCVVTDDLDGVLVCTYGTVCAKSPEFAVDGSFRSCYQRSANRQRQIGNIVYDTNGKSLFLCIFIYSNDLSRCGVLGTKSVTTCEYRCALEFAAF